MNTIWKYPLQTWGRQTLELPVGARILSLGAQKDERYGYTQPVLWAMVTPYGPVEERELYLAETGVSDSTLEDDRWRFVGTATDGEMGWHLFEARPQGP